MHYCLDALCKKRALIDECSKILSSIKYMAFNNYKFIVFVASHTFIYLYSHEQSIYHDMIVRNLRRKKIYKFCFLFLPNLAFQSSYEQRHFIPAFLVFFSALRLFLLLLLLPHSLSLSNTPTLQLLFSFVIFFSLSISLQKTFNLFVVGLIYSV
jgi:hypothetical protein